MDAKEAVRCAMTDSMNRGQKLHIVTVEDPIEFLHQSNQSLINQRELGGHTSSFARAPENWSGVPPPSVQPFGQAPAVMG